MSFDLRFADSHINDKEVLNLSQDLIRIRSVFGEEHAIAEFISGKLESWGFSPKQVEVEGHGPCVVAEVGNADSPRIIFNGHMDTVEVMSGWSRDPFGAEIEGGLLYGLGALDMKCGLASLMTAFNALSKSPLMDTCRLCFHAVPGEEKDGNGTRRLIQSGEYSEASAVIVGEGFGGLRVLTHGRRGGSYYNLKVRGKSAHGATPQKGVNAVVDAAAVVVALGELQLSETDGLISEDSTPLAETLTVLSIHGGTGSLTVPDSCAIKLVKGTVPGGKTDCSPEIVALIDSLGLSSRVSVEFLTNPKDQYHPYVTPADSNLVRAASDAIMSLMGWRPILVCGISEADDNIIAYELGVPVICMGPGEPGPKARYHQADEAISVEQLGHAARVYARTVETLARGKIEAGQGRATSS